MSDRCVEFRQRSHNHAVATLNAIARGKRTIEENLEGYYFVKPNEVQRRNPYDERHPLNVWDYID